jgi:hypothetical protein
MHHASYNELCAEWMVYYNYHMNGGMEKRMERLGRSVNGSVKKPVS